MKRIGQHPHRIVAASYLLAAVAVATGRGEPAGGGFPLPALARDGAGVVRADLNGDGHDDIVVSNAAGYGVYLFVPPAEARDGLDWKSGWTRVIREGTPGDTWSLPRFDGPQVAVGERCIRVGDRRLDFEELLRIPFPAPRTPAESLATMQVRDGFSVTLAAAEPDVFDPVFIDWDESGRMWVAEMGVPPPS